LNGESDWLDWKGDFPEGLRSSRDREAYEDGRGELLKDLCALANGFEVRAAFLIYGVVDQGLSRYVKGCTGSWDDAKFQNWNRDVFDPPLDFLYEEVETAGVRIGVFSIKRSPRYPHVTRRTVGTYLHDGQVWFRRGTENQVAHHEELQRMLVGEEPLVYDRMGDEQIRKFEAEIRLAGFEPGLPELARRAAKEFEGWRTFHPAGTRKEVHVLTPPGPLVLMMYTPAGGSS
jgi:hypothetical protein